jgi:hypothetical protein
MNAKTSLKCKSGEIITSHINPEIVFKRALVLANSRDDVTIDNILFPVRNISAFYDLEHLCMGSHFGTTLSFSRLDGGFLYVIPVKYICYYMCFCKAWCQLSAVVGSKVSKGYMLLRDDVTIDNILSHPVGPIPVSMFHEDDTMRKSCKSDLVKQFENEASPVFSLPVFYPLLTTYIREMFSILTLR